MTPAASHNDVVLITGCGSGIGKALARAFHRQGRRVCATARKLDAMADLAAEGIDTHVLDVTCEADVQALLSALQAQGLWVQTLVNNAGYGAMGPMLDVPAAEWQRQFDVNLFAPIALARAVLPAMVAQRQGCIANISSVSGVMVTPFAGPYCASKAAFNAASRAMFAMSRAGTLPKPFSHIHPKHRTPDVAIISNGQKNSSS